MLPAAWNGLQAILLNFTEAPVNNTIVNYILYYECA
jgi:hypothetical protein